ncbi:hypothetical protein GCK32_013405 [Trichostrongylus colubriformis]|uniref:Neurotransmitter-gated ion-channel ligand-binding domain-containing protein n=1 Tax=Trichostrongylus colubriformis TaxID=6319 RepID=A0AAN8IVZ2_TRICO
MQSTFFLCVCSTLVLIFAQEEPEGIDDEGGDAEEIYNKTYSEHQSALEKAIFRDYVNTRRPVRNSSQPLEVSIHFHIVHVSINQEEQTMTVHGHLYMTWIDEFLVWDVNEYNGIRITRSSKWRIWQPKILTVNSVSGIFSAFEISSHAHVILQSLGKTQTRIEMYPTFSIKVGCDFEFSDYPNDVNSCAISVFTKQRMTEVILKNYYDMPPTLSIASRVPKSVLFYTLTMLCNMFSLVVHILLVVMEQQRLYFVRPVMHGVGSAIAVRLPFPPKSPIVALRIALGLFVFLLYIVFIFAFLIF